ncbi:MAG: hypothetical protein LWX51_04675 [Deltaproteobacteria bacterium]|jgi:hypothetical protein|nr:hypothetical protein [Deltaproteobacteria bacterium]
MIYSISCDYYKAPDTNYGEHGLNRIYGQHRSHRYTGKRAIVYFKTYPGGCFLTAAKATIPEKIAMILKLLVLYHRLI